MRRKLNSFKKWGLGLLGYFLGWRLRKSLRFRAPDIVLIDLIAGWLIKKPKQARGDRGSYVQSINNVKLWHGTGRYQYGRSGGKKDVFVGLIEDGRLKTFEDTFDYRLGEVKSISLARPRMYARIYADMHQYNGIDSSERYGMPKFWSLFFIMATAISAIKEMKLYKPSKRKEYEKDARSRGNREWSIKVRKSPVRGWGDFFNEGSDIEGNYPILIGLNDDDFEKIETSEYVQRFEVRSAEAINISSIQHIEVPYNNVSEIQEIIDTYNLNTKVYSIEFAEGVYSDFRLSELVKS